MFQRLRQIPDLPFFQVERMYLYSKAAKEYIALFYLKNIEYFVFLCLVNKSVPSSVLYRAFGCQHKLYCTNNKIQLTGTKAAKSGWIVVGGAAFMFIVLLSVVALVAIRKKQSKKAAAAAAFAERDLEMAPPEGDGGESDETSMLEGVKSSAQL